MADLDTTERDDPTESSSEAATTREDAAGGMGGTEGSGAASSAPAGSSTPDDDDNDNDDRNCAVGDHVSWPIGSVGLIGASYHDGSQTPLCGIVHSFKKNKKVAHVRLHDAQHHVTSNYEDHPTADLEPAASRPPVREAVALPLPEVETPDMPKRAGAAIPTVVTGPLSGKRRLRPSIPTGDGSCLSGSKKATAASKINTSRTPVTINGTKTYANDLLST